VNSFFEFIFFEERMEWIVESGSFFEFTFFEERMEKG